VVECGGLESRCTACRYRGFESLPHRKVLMITTNGRPVMLRKISADPLTVIPGVGKSIAQDLRIIGIHAVNDLKGKNPEQLYQLSNQAAGTVQDRCLLYVFRCAVYYAEGGHHDEKLKWWNWKDAPLKKSRRNS
jgi:hypothetical protein